MGEQEDIRSQLPGSLGVRDGVVIIDPALRPLARVRAGKLEVWVAAWHIPYEGERLVGLYGSAEAVLAAHPGACKKFEDSFEVDELGYRELTDAWVEGPAVDRERLAYWLETVNP